MSDKLNDGLKKMFYTGIGAAALAVDLTGKAVNTLAEKGEKAVEKGKVMNEELKRKRAKSEVDIKDMAEALGQMSKEEIESVRVKLSEVEDTMDKATSEMKVNATAIISSLEKMGRDDIEYLKAAIEEIKASWKDSDDDDQGTAG